MQKFLITGMGCAACQNRVEKAVSELAGVDSVAVSLLTNTMQVEGTAIAREIIDRVEEAGYKAELLPDGEETENIYEEVLTDKDTPKLQRRLIYSIVFLAPLMYLSMGHTMWGWSIPNALEGNYFAIGLVQMLLTVIILVINRRFL